MKNIEASMIAAYDSLNLHGRKNKEIPKEFEPQILYALSYFPELTSDRIEFRLKKTGRGIIATRPAWLSIFRRGDRRKYIVIISDPADKRMALWRNAPVNGQVGIVGHELCHILYFRKRTGFGLIALGVRHLSRKFMDRFEYETDSVDIERGLAYQLLDWNIYLRRAFGMMNPEAEPLSGSRQRERYMRPATIRRMIKKTPIYHSLE